MLIVAWLAAIISSVPQSFFFHVIKHKKFDYYQCVTYEILSEEEQVINQ
jgi:hypothetical protein